MRSCWHREVLPRRNCPLVPLRECMCSSECSHNSPWPKRGLPFGKGVCTDCVWDPRAPGCDGILLCDS
eukprot:2258155-Prymnesium_polylepis.1